MSIINVQDQYRIQDAMANSLISKRLQSGPKKNKITITDHNTGEVLAVVTNKILVAGSQSTACKQFGLELDKALKLPTYNSELGLDNSYPDWSQQPINDPITCLWCAGRTSGAATTPTQVAVVSNTDRIKPSYYIEDGDIIPFRFVDADNDLDFDQRQKYFGKKTFTENETGLDGKVGYFFKKFDTEPQLHVRYLDGTEVSSDMYTTDSDQSVEVFVELRLSVNRLDFRDYFSEYAGWDLAQINTISLVTAWFKDFEDGDISYNYYQDIIPFSKFNFKAEQLVDITREIDFNYQVYY